jgi:hypothetical protein
LRLSVLCLTLSFFGTQASADVSTRPMQVATGPGGSVVEYAKRVSKARLGGHAVTFRGRCGSACTLFLALPTSDICITPGASFQFHRPYGASKEFNAWAEEFMLGNYPPWVRRWIEDRGGLSHRLLRMDYSYAAKFIPTCRTASVRHRHS